MLSLRGEILTHYVVGAFVVVVEVVFALVATCSLLYVLWFWSLYCCLWF